MDTALLRRALQHYLDIMQCTANFYREQRKGMEYAQTLDRLDEATLAIRELDKLEKRAVKR